MGNVTLHVSEVRKSAGGYIKLSLRSVAGYNDLVSEPIAPRATIGAAAVSPSARAATPTRSAPRRCVAAQVNVEIARAGLQVRASVCAFALACFAACCLRWVGPRCHQRRRTRAR